MKSDFNVDINLMQLTEVLQDKEPYAALVVSTTGLDNNNCDKHSPTRVQVVQFEFDADMQAYSPSITFNRLVAADIEAVDAAIASAESGGYDAFASACIDPVSYKNQVLDPDLAKGVPEDQRVYTQEEFKKSFDYVMQGLQRDNTTIIANGYEHSQKYLDKIGCGEMLRQMDKQDKVIDQPHLGGEYLHSIGRDDLTKAGTGTLENVRNALTPVPPAVEKRFATPDVLKDFKELSKEDFLDAHKNISEQAYKMKVRDDEFRAAKATAPERIDVINQMITSYGREHNLLESAHIQRMRQNEAQRFGAASERGRQKYQNSSVEAKIKTQIEMGNIDRDAVLEGNSEYQRLMEAMHGDHGNKGVVFVHIATSGLNNPQGNETGLPMQFAARAIAINPDGEGFILDKEHSRAFKFFMELPPETVLKAEEQAKQKGGFDVFKDAGVSPDEVREGGKGMKEATFVNYVDTFFKQYADYDIVVLGGGKGNEDKAFFQKALQSICNLDVINKDTIDFTSATVAYSLLTTEGEIPDNAIFKDNTTTGFGIRQVGNAIGVEVKDTTTKLLAATIATDKLYTQYLELNPEISASKEEVKTEPERAEQNAPTDARETVDDFVEVDEPVTPVQENNEEPDFADEDEGYDNTYTENDEEADREAFEDSLAADDVEEDAPATPTPVQETKKQPEAPAPAEVQRPARPERPERRQVQEVTERPKRVEPAPAPKADVNNDMIASLLATITQQNETIARQNEVILEQSKTIASQDEKLFKAFELVLNQQKEQNAIVKAALINQARTAPKDKVIPLAPLKGSTLDKLEQIKDNIDKICEDVPDKVREHLRDANSSITEGQVELETPEKESEPRPVA